MQVKLILNDKSDKGLYGTTKIKCYFNTIITRKKTRHKYRVVAEITWQQNTLPTKLDYA